MYNGDPKQATEETPEIPGTVRDAFDIRALEAMPEDEAAAEWLRHPEAWHMH